MVSYTPSLPPSPIRLSSSVLCDCGGLYTGEIVLADIIDADSWRLWPLGDRRLQKDKQFYRDMADVTPEALQQVKRNFQWIADKLDVS